MKVITSSRSGSSWALFLLLLIGSGFFILLGFRAETASRFLAIHLALLFLIGALQCGRRLWTPCITVLDVVNGEILLNIRKNENVRTLGSYRIDDLASISIDTTESPEVFLHFRNRDRVALHHLTELTNDTIEGLRQVLKEQNPDLPINGS